MQATINKQSKTDEWFDEFVASIKADQLAIETGVASEGKKEMYESLMDNNITDLIDINVKSAQKHYIGSMLLDYVKSLSKFEDEAPFNTLAVSFNNSDLLVWAEIEDDADDIERELILAEARINAQYHDKGFDMTTTIVEKCDQLSVPSHYILLYGKESH